MTWRVPDRNAPAPKHQRLILVRLFFIIVCVTMIARLFDLQILRGSVYTALAAGQHELYRKLFPVRGSVYVREGSGLDQLFPLVTNRDLHLLYAIPSQVVDASTTAATLVDLLGLPESVSLAQAEGELFADIDPGLDPAVAAEIKQSRRQNWQETQRQQEITRLRALLSKPDDPYEPLRHRLTAEQVEAIKALEIEGLGFQTEVWRYYPESGMGGHLFGFWGFSDDERKGRYGLEGYFDEELAGTFGEIHSERDAWGNLIAVGTQSLKEKVDGADLVLTIDRAIQYKACQELQAAVERYQAEGGTVIIMEPATGAIVAMCGAPDYDPANYRSVASIKSYNNPAISTSYEPGSIFKVITMAAALDAGKVTPQTTYDDTGSVVIGPYTIKNFDDKIYGRQTMTQVLENSINTGTIFAMRQMGPKVFAKYLRDFGFGQMTGVTLSGEATGDIRNVETHREIYAATASFGQGLSVTPLQMVTAVAAIANGGTLMRPYLVDAKLRNGEVIEQMRPQAVRRVVSAKAAAMTGGMMVNVVEHGHGAHAAVPGYRVAGKTGTAQTAAAGGGYDPDNVVVSFVGFAPFEHPRFAMLVMLDRPQRGKEAATTVTYTFQAIAKFILTYYNIPRDI